MLGGAAGRFAHGHGFALRRAIRAQVGGTSSANAQGAVPTNMPAKAQRLNPLKAEPINKKIHASARGRKKTFEGKRDAR